MSSQQESINVLDFDSLRPACPRLSEEHHAWRQQVRSFVTESIQPHINEWNGSGTFPDELFVAAANAGILGMGFPATLGGTLPDASLYHRIIFSEELHRLGSGVVFADLATHWIGLPPVVRQNDARLNEQVVGPVLRGEKKISFAVTEPGGGSDVNALASRAEKTPAGWRVNGEKTLISGAMRADYILAAVKTGSGDEQGISLLLIDARSAGIEREPVRGLNWYNASLGSIRFTDTVVPLDNLIGPENRGFLQLLPQFNIERFSGVAATLGMARVCVAEAIAFARKRQVFGKRLIDQQVIRHKLVDLVRAIRVGYAYLDQCVEQFELGANTVADLALLKVQATSTLEQCAREAMQVLAGTAYRDHCPVERIFRESRTFAIGGGTEEVLRDLVAKQLRF